MFPWLSSCELTWLHSKLVLMVWGSLLDRQEDSMNAMKSKTKWGVSVPIFHSYPLEVLLCKTTWKSILSRAGESRCHLALWGSLSGMYICVGTSKMLCVFNWLVLSLNLVLDKGRPSFPWGCAHLPRLWHTLHLCAWQRHRTHSVCSFGFLCPPENGYRAEIVYFVFLTWPLVRPSPAPGQVQFSCRSAGIHLRSFFAVISHYFPRWA